MSGDAANVHSIGWMDTGSRVRISFDPDSGFTPSTAVAALDINADTAALGHGAPDISASQPLPGTMVLFVNANNQPGCYRYKVEVEPPAAASVILSKAAKSATPRFRPMAIAGLASSAKHCVAGNYVANVHSIGRVEQGTQVRVTFDSDFDPVGGIALVDPVGRAGNYVIDDNSVAILSPTSTSPLRAQAWLRSTSPATRERRAATATRLRSLRAQRHPLRRLRPPHRRRRLLRHPPPLQARLQVHGREPCRGGVREVIPSAKPRCPQPRPA